MMINEQGTTFGRVLLKSETLLHFDPQTLRDAMDNALREAVRVADEQVELDGSSPTTSCAFCEARRAARRCAGAVRGP